MNLSTQLYQFTALLAAISFFVPIALLMIRKLLQNKTLVWFGAFWCWSGLVNAVCSIEAIEQSPVIDIIGRLYNLADIPVVLFILYSTTQTESIKKSIGKILKPVMFIAIAVSVIAWFNEGIETAVVFGGVLLVLYYIIWSVLVNSRKNSFSESQASYQYIYYALLFEYAISIITVIYSYIVPEKANGDDRFLIFHLSTIITIATATAGILIYNDQKPKSTFRKQKFQPEAEIRYL